MASRFVTSFSRAAVYARSNLLKEVTPSKISTTILCRYNSSETRPGLSYSKDHEWVKVDAGVATIGITNFAQDQLGDVVYCELPEVGTEVAEADAVGTIESVKAVSDIFSPASGEIVAINELLMEGPNLLNSAPFDEGWLFKLRLTSPEEIDQLLSEAEYKKFIEEGV